jgi:hypothetical protein
VAAHRSIIPTVPGIPSWGAVLIAVTFATIGFAYDAGSGGKELTMAFAVAYGAGCILAVLAVRQAAVFTAVIQPPLILFIVVPGAYFIFHGGSVDGIKEIAINCGYPLIERFPVMFFTSAIVLLIGMVRWYMGMSARRAAPAEAEPVETEGRMSAVTSKISGLLGRSSDGEADDDVAAPKQRQHSIDRTGKTRKTAASTARTRSGRPVKRTQPSRSRHTRPPETEIIEPVAERPRRPRPVRKSAEPTLPPAEPRRRPRPPAARERDREREPRKQPPPGERRARPRPDRHSRFDGFEPIEPRSVNGNGNGAKGSPARNGDGGHHPVSRVRYRAADDGEQRQQYRTRPRPARHQAEADAWEYDA